MQQTTRESVIRELTADPEIPVLIIGGGINGIGTFRELATNGVRVLLIERDDFCSGASAASSRMAHGGLRYLENGEFSLVREALHERDRLLRNAPHLVVPLPTTIPIFRHLSGLLNAPLRFTGLRQRPSERGTLVISIGLLLYELLAGVRRKLPRFRMRSGHRARQLWPELHPDVVATASYFDGAIRSPERLAMEVLLDAEAEGQHARALNYIRFAGVRDGALELVDEVSGLTLAVRPRAVVNAAGPWIDICNAALGAPTRLVGGTKGSHIVVAHPALRRAIGDHEFFFENRDGRIVLLLPLEDRVLIGTTDIPVENPDNVACTESEVDYFLEMVERVFPGIGLKREQIVFRYSGVRPLEWQQRKEAGQITRSHRVAVLAQGESGLPFPVYSLVGGKWTSFRALSAQAADKVMGRLGIRRRRGTEDLRIGGGKDLLASRAARAIWTRDVALRTGTSVENIEILANRYGSRAEAIASFGSPDARRLLAALPGHTRGELEFLATFEKVVHLDDLLLRRTTLAVLGRLTVAGVQEAAAVVAGIMGWSETEREAEIERVIRLLAGRHGVRLSA